ncbi:MAG: cobaltochelatase subunit CobN, partial [Desulfosarcina sp.]|nr:cobaltochelatase subunit CobN [Desulfobacterales bacterium]
MKTKISFLIFFFFNPFFFICGVAPCLAERLSFLVIYGDTCVVNKAFNELELPDKIKADFFTFADIEKDKKARDFIASSEVIIVDVMMQDLNDYVITNLDIDQKRIYAVRGSRDDKGLQAQGFIFDPLISSYFKNLSVNNIKNLIRWVVQKEFDPAVTFGKVEKKPNIGIYHYGAETISSNYEEYSKWYKKRKNYRPDAARLGIMFFSSSLMTGQVDAVNYTIKKFEQAGFNVTACFGRDADILT